MNIYDIWFSRVEISNKIKLKLLEEMNSEKLWKVDKKELFYLKLKDSTIQKILDVKYRKNLEKYEQYLEKNNIFLFSYKDELYPEKLKYISDKPAYIFVRRKFKSSLWR